ncbi:MAG: heparinase II/III-family protein [Deferribacterales bacterium]
MVISRAFAGYVRKMGLRWLCFRLVYAFKIKTGFFGRANRRISAKSQSSPVGFSQSLFSLVSKEYKCTSEPEKIRRIADNAINGRIRAFSSAELDYAPEGKIFWNYNPVSGKKSSKEAEWQNIPDFGSVGDIKLIWEISRFPQIFHFISAHSATQDKKYAHACIEQIRLWIEDNPFPCGVNYKCGQEIAFRVFAWFCALSYFEDYVDADLREEAARCIHTSLLRIESNISFAAESVRNNHSVSEAAGLFIGGLYLAKNSDTERFISKGIRYLLSQTVYQVYADGGYIQHSMNYHRLVTDVLSLVIIAADKNDFPLPEEIRTKHSLLCGFLYSAEIKNGKLPNYGPNDGALLFPLTETDYMDYRESINLASAVNSGAAVYNGADALISFFGIKNHGVKADSEKKNFFPDSGYFFLRKGELALFTRCHSYRHRPHQCDMLHLDIWAGGDNIFCDSGSYSYNTDIKIKENFTGICGHNTVEINGVNPMDRYGSFGWSGWYTAKLISASDNFLECEHYGYKDKFGAVHNRKIELFDDSVLITDRIYGHTGKLTVKQFWNSAEKFSLFAGGAESEKGVKLFSDGDINLDTSYISAYYNSYTEGSRIVVSAGGSEEIIISTRIIF